MEDESRTQQNTDEEEVEAHRRPHTAPSEEPGVRIGHSDEADEDEVEGHRFVGKPPSEPGKRFSPPEPGKRF